MNNNAKNVVFFFFLICNSGLKFLSGFSRRVKHYELILLLGRKGKYYGNIKAMKKLFYFVKVQEEKTESGSQAVNKDADST